MPLKGQSGYSNFMSKLLALHAEGRIGPSLILVNISALFWVEATGCLWNYYNTDPFKLLT